MVVITLSGFMQSSATGWRGGSANAFSPSHSRRMGTHLIPLDNAKIGPGGLCLRAGPTPTPLSV